MARLRRRWWALALASVLVLCLAGPYVWLRPKFTPSVSRENFRTLHTGMPLSEIEGVLGSKPTWSGTFRAYDDVWMQKYNWKNDSGEECDILFVRGTDAAAYGEYRNEFTKNVASLAPPVSLADRVRAWLGW